MEVEEREQLYVNSLLFASVDTMFHITIAQKGHAPKHIFSQQPTLCANQSKTHGSNPRKPIQLTLKTLTKHSQSLYFFEGYFPIKVVSQVKHFGLVWAVCWLL